MEVAYYSSEEVFACTGVSSNTRQYHLIIMMSTFFYLLNIRHKLSENIIPHFWAKYCIETVHDAIYKNMPLIRISKTTNHTFHYAMTTLRAATNRLDRTPRLKSGYSWDISRFPLRRAVLPAWFERYLHTGTRTCTLSAPRPIPCPRDPPRRRTTHDRRVSLRLVGRRTSDGKKRWW